MTNTRKSKGINMKMLKKKKGHQNHKMWRKKVRKSRFSFFRMCLSLYDYWVKASRCRKGLAYLKNRANTSQNQKIHSQELKRREDKHKIIKWNDTKRVTKEKYRINRKTRFKMAIKYVFVNIYLKVNGLKAPIKRHRVADCIKKIRAYNMLPTWDSY